MKRIEATQEKLRELLGNPDTVKPLLGMRAALGTPAVVVSGVDAMPLEPDAVLAAQAAADARDAVRGSGTSGEHVFSNGAAYDATLLTGHSIKKGRREGIAGAYKTPAVSSKEATAAEVAATRAGDDDGDEEADEKMAGAGAKKPRRTSRGLLSGEYVVRKGRGRTKRASRMFVWNKLPNMI